MKVNSTILATAIVIIFITVITIAADLSPLLKGWLKETFGHHWVGKSVMATLLWITIAAVPIKFSIYNPKILIITLFAGVLSISIFYILLYIF